MMASVYGLLNRLLPFATPGTPLLQDLLHLATLCALLYFAPQIQAQIQSARARTAAADDHQIGGDPPRQRNPEPTAEPAEHNDHHIIEEVRGEGTEDEEADAPTDDDANNAPIPAALHEPPGPDAAVPGPANADQPPRTIHNRQVGAKKAKSLARRDQRRAYNEFLRSQGDNQRALEASTAAERQAALNAERERRAAVEAELRAKAEAEREARREEEIRVRAAEMRAREVAISLVRDQMRERGFSELIDAAAKVGRSTEWVEGLVKAEGMAREVKGLEVVFVTEDKVLVRVSKGDLAECWRLLAMRSNVSGQEGKISLEQAGQVLEGVVRGRATAAAS